MNQLVPGPGTEMEQDVGRTAIDSIEALHEALTAKYGHLLRPDQVAEVLDVSTESLSNTLRRSREPNVLYLISKSCALVAACVIRRFP